MTDVGKNTVELLIALLQSFSPVRPKPLFSILPVVKVKFLNSKVGALSDNLGNYRLETYYATDTLVVVFPGYLPQKKVIKLDEKQVITILSLYLEKTLINSFLTSASDLEKPGDEDIIEKLMKNFTLNNQNITREELLQKFIEFEKKAREELIEQN